MSVLPDKVSHGGTYAGNRVVAAAAAVKTLEIIRDTDALETIRPPAARVQAGLRKKIEAKGAWRTTSRATPRCSAIMFTETVATEYRDWADTDHELYDQVAIGMHALGAMPEPDSRSRGSCARRKPGGHGGQA